MTCLVSVFVRCLHLILGSCKFYLDKLYSICYGVTHGTIKAHQSWPPEHVLRVLNTLYIEVIKYVNESWNRVLGIRIDARFVVPVSNETMKTVPIAQSFKGNSPRRNQTQKCWRRILWFSRAERRRKKECQERVINKNAHHKGEHRSNINIFLLLAGQ